VFFVLYTVLTVIAFKLGIKYGKADVNALESAAATD
jgi:hypothetical protein